MNVQHPAKSGDYRTFQPLSETSSNRVRIAVLGAICALMCLFVVFRPFFTSGFDLTEGDLADGRFELTVLEHWDKVFRGQALIASPNFFYPEKGVLGNSDTFLGLALPHALLRSLGIDRYLSVQLATMLLTALGFWAMYSLLRVMRFTPLICLTGACLFIVSNMYYIYVVHPYILVSVVTAPGLFVLIVKFWHEKDVHRAMALVWLCSCGVLLALLLYTSYYIGWFLIFSTTTVVIFNIACAFIAERQPRPVLQKLQAAWAEKWSIALGILVFIGALVPFVMLYLPVLHRTGKRNMAEVIYYLPPLLGVFDVGRDNVVWGRMSARLEAFMYPGGVREHPAGWPLVTICLFLATTVHCGVRLWRSRQEDDGREKRRLCLITAIALSCLILWPMAVRVGQHAPLWALLMKFAPGAAAIRVPQRINLVLNIGVVVVCMFGFERLRRALPARGGLHYVVPILFGIALMGEQTNLMLTHAINRAWEAQKFARISAPPHECSAFYASTWNNQRPQMQWVQTDAMLVAQQYDIPTINGYSSWFPQSWNLLWSAKGHVGEEAAQWARQHGITEGLCSLDINSGTWSKVNIHAYESAAYLGQPADRNLADAGFEDPDLALWSPWLDVHAAITTAPVHSGLHSLAETDGVGSVYQDITGLEPGHTYRISGWVSSSPAATAGAQIAVAAPGESIAVFSNNLHPGVGWQLLSASITVHKPGAVRVHLFRTEGTGTIYWDDLKVYHDDQGPEQSTHP